jgi:hypothetical protein
MGKEIMVYIHNGVLFSYKNKIGSFAGKLEIMMLSKISQTQKDKWVMFLSYGESRSKNTNKHKT